jgi:hypothetical protein
VIELTRTYTLLQISQLGVPMLHPVSREVVLPREAPRCRHHPQQASQFRS